MIRYAIRFDTPIGSIFHMQGLPKLKEEEDGFQFAVLYASRKHAESAVRQSKLRTRIEAMKSRGTVVSIVEVECKFGAEYVI